MQWGKQHSLLLRLLCAMSRDHTSAGLDRRFTGERGASTHASDFPNLLRPAPQKFAGKGGVCRKARDFGDIITNLD